MERQEMENSPDARNPNSDLALIQELWNNKLAEVKCSIIPKEYMYFQMEGISKTTMPDDITAEYVLNNVKHLIILRKVSDYAVHFHNEVSQLKYEWDGVPGGANAAVWDRFMNPEMKKLQTSMKKENWSEAFASLFGIFLFFGRDAGNWIIDTEQPDLSSIGTWVRKYANSWKKLLTTSDEEIGLYQIDGKPGVYRALLVEVLKKHQEMVNTSVLVKLDAEGTKKIRISIFPAEKSSKSPSSKSPLIRSPSTKSPSSKSPARKSKTPQKENQSPNSPLSPGSGTISVATPSPTSQQGTPERKRVLPAFSAVVAGIETTVSPGGSSENSMRQPTPKKMKVTSSNDAMVSGTSMINTFAGNAGAYDLSAFAQGDL